VSVVVVGVVLVTDGVVVVVADPVVVCEVVVVVVLVVAVGAVDVDDVVCFGRRSLDASVASISCWTVATAAAIAAGVPFASVTGPPTASRRSGRRSPPSCRFQCILDFVAIARAAHEGARARVRQLADQL
jgi:hypothetical protein